MKRSRSRSRSRSRRVMIGGMCPPCIAVAGAAAGKYMIGAASLAGAGATLVASKRTRRRGTIRTKRTRGGGKTKTKKIKPNEFKKMISEMERSAWSEKEKCTILCNKIRTNYAKDKKKHRLKRKCHGNCEKERMKTVKKFHKKYPKEYKVFVNLGGGGKTKGRTKKRSKLHGIVLELFQKDKKNKLSNIHYGKKALEKYADAAFKDRDETEKKKYMKQWDKTKLPNSVYFVYQSKRGLSHRFISDASKKGGHSYLGHRER